MPKENKTRALIRELMKGKSEEEILEAEENFMNYLLVIKEIAGRLEEGKSIDSPEENS